jgi:hypothetical protein
MYINKTVCEQNEKQHDDPRSTQSKACKMWEDHTALKMLTFWVVTLRQPVVRYVSVAHTVSSFSPADVFFLVTMVIYLLVHNASQNRNNWRRTKAESYYGKINLIILFKLTTGLGKNSDYLQWQSINTNKKAFGWTVTIYKHGV